jgi:hypothetical protein
MTLNALPQPAARSIQNMLQAELRQLEALRGRSSIRSDVALEQRLDRAIRTAGNPTCAESQPDGVPCGNVEKACEQCTEALDFARRVRHEMEAEAERRETALGARMAGWEGDLP